MAEVAKQDNFEVSRVNAWFFKETSLEELLSGARSLSPIEELALDDLTPEEAATFLDAIRE